MAAMESTDAQQKGIASIYYAVDAHFGKSVNSALRASLPVRFGSVHLCYSDLQEYTKTLYAVSQLSPNLLTRFRTHFGMYELTYPIFLLHALA